MGEEIVLINKLLKILLQFDYKKDQNIDWDIIASNIYTSVAYQQPLTLIQFTCSTINPSYMFDQKNPELYVSLDPNGNNMEPDLPVLEKLYLRINKIYPTKIIILIGNTDPFYIYSQEGKIYPEIPTAELLQRFNKRWSVYKKNLEKYFKKNYPKIEIEIISWYELEQKLLTELNWNFMDQFISTKNQIKQLFDQKDFNWELNKLKDQFGPGKYFYNLEKPSDTILKQWILRKFTEYAVQGLWIKLLFPEGIFLQNEKPSDLRTSMYQPLIKKLLNSRLPIIYPFGVDNSGYQ